jgi:hypothetical protein
MRYADSALRLAMETGNAHNSTWLREHDEATRGRTVILARGGIPFGEALDQAWAEAKVEWSFKNSLTIGKRPVRSRSRSQRGSRPKNDNQQRKKVGSTLPGGIAICSDYNNGRCVKDANKCPKKRKHVCDVVDEGTGKVCGLRHTRDKHI